jgi:hypothetical protein
MYNIFVIAKLQKEVIYLTIEGLKIYFCMLNVLYSFKSHFIIFTSLPFMHTARLWNRIENQRFLKWRCFYETIASNWISTVRTAQFQNILPSIYSLWQKKKISINTIDKFCEIHTAPIYGDKNDFFLLDLF